MYLLLRNNKQSGPYSLEDLKNMGMKPYDLVWLEGKSAAWRYPSEIDELKEFAPAVEEQPFDRFYKKPGATAGTATAVATTAAIAASTATAVAATATIAASTAADSVGEKETTTIAFRPAASSGESTVTTGKRIIYVTLPAGRSAPIRETAARETPVRESPVREMPVREIQRESERPRAAVAGPPTPVPPIAAIGDYTALPERLNVAPVEFAPRRKPANKQRLLQFAGVGICILALLAAGIFIGLSLNKESLGLQKRIASGTTSPSATKQAVPVEPASTLPVYDAATSPNSTMPLKTASNAGVPARNSTVGSTADKSGLQNDAVSNASNSSAAVKKIRKQKEKIPAAIMPPVQKDSMLTVVPVETREAIHRTATQPADNKEAEKSAIANEVSVGASHYSVGTFGGINDLQVTVTNRSAWPLDQVVVEVQYIQANKKVYKTENLYFRGIGPGAAMMQEAPKSSRGIRVQYKITSISSKELGLSYSGL